ncbi:sulfatase family protein [Pontiella sulfatireligans]|uniref:Arylsulfatase n=1 Tax=Pontiella sulfatireligans TaxID=2750658 RepID=A0A6C2UDM3_9BACT|nr:sulfatase [Pontiella sulfatireligans]SPS74146.1 sulfatase S1_11 [Kiritimatiellales bacterium]VGO18298.1 Arylsulfatase [Pontiella sulfatireligans]
MMMNRLWAPCLAFLYSALSALAADRPNILFVMSDDHTSQAIGAYGGRLASLNPTPTIDALATEGMVMENAFCQNAICTPSRSSIMTGQGNAVNGCIVLGLDLPPDRQYLAIEMKKAGYQTAVVGKWHLKSRPEAFDYYKTLIKQGDYFDPTFEVPDSEGGKVQMSGHSTDCITESALDWFEKKRDKTKPFFFALQYKAPHSKFLYAPRYENYLADVTIPEPENMRDRKNHGSIATRGNNGELIKVIGGSVGRRNKFFNNVKPNSRYEWANGFDQTQSDADILSDGYQAYLKSYLRCVKGVDDNLKRVIEYLKAEGLYENTVIMYTGDQGFYLGEHDYVDKRWPYEESMRMPFIVRYPGGVKVGRSDAIVENIDYAPTMLDFAGVETPDYMQGKSFKSILETGNEPEGWKQSAYYHFWMHMSDLRIPGNIGIRTKRYKLIQFYGCRSDQSQPDSPPAWELYDLKLDPAEDNNVYDNPEYASVIADLKTQLKARRAELGEDDPKFACNQVINEFWEYGPEERARAIEIADGYALKKKVKFEKSQGKKRKKK